MKYLAMPFIVLLIVVPVALADIMVDIPQQYKTVAPGAEVIANIKLVNLGGSGREDVFLDFWMTDSKGSIVLTKRETVAVETQANFVRTFVMPQDTKTGSYTLHAEITYSDGRDATAANDFQVEPRKDVPTDYRPIYVGAAVALLVIFFFAGRLLMPVWKRFQIRFKVKSIVSKRH
jgi:hypothetical protein